MRLLPISLLFLNIQPVFGQDNGAEDSPAKPRQSLSANRLELSGTPIFGYDSNTGLDLGALLNVAQFDPQRFPYDYRINLLLRASLKDSPEGLKTPLQEHYLDYEKLGLTSPFHPDREMRLRSRLGYFHNQQTGYYGIGAGAERETQRLEENFDYYFYQSTEAFCWTQLRITLAQLNRQIERKTSKASASQDIEFFTRLDTRVHLTGINEKSQLAKDVESSDEFTQAELIATGDHFKIESTVGLILDTRDHELDPQSGMLHDVSIRGGITTLERHNYYGFNLTTRFYLPLIKRYWSLALRGMADLLGGEPPFYELSERGGLRSGIATGGADSIRGLLARRYHGKLKVLTNVESRFLAPPRRWT